MKDIANDPFFWRKVRKTDYCWIWQGAVNGKGYGCYVVRGKSELVHRLAYESFVAPIPDDYTIDHECRVRNCVNPDHLEPVTNAENNRRKFTAGGLWIGGQCIRGHAITEETAYHHPRGHIECITCRRESRQRRKERVAS